VVTLRRAEIRHRIRRHVERRIMGDGRPLSARLGHDFLLALLDAKNFCVAAS